MFLALSGPPVRPLAPGSATMFPTPVPPRNPAIPSPRHGMKQASILLALLLAPTVTAQEPAPRPDPAAPAVQEKETRFIKHLLHLQDGRILRVKARATDAGWEIQQKRDTLTLPESLVVKAVREREKLNEAKKLARGVNKKDPQARVALAEWMFGEGLGAEALDELNPLLVKHPDQPQALALLKRERPNLNLPRLEPNARSVTTYLRTVASTKPAVKEVAVQRLAELDGTLDLQATLRQELVQSSQRRRAFAAHALRRLYPGQEVKAMLNRAVLDASDDVRIEACRALRDTEEPAVILPVIKALGSKSSSVRSNAASALGNMGYPHAVEPLINHLSTVHAAAQSGSGFRPPASNIFVGKQVAYVQDYDVEVAQGASIADPTINTLMEGSVLDVRVLAVSQSQIASEKAAVRRALTSLTGANPGHSTKAWEAWWDKHGAEWKAASANPSTPTTPGR